MMAQLMQRLKQIKGLPVVAGLLLLGILLLALSYLLPQNAEKEAYPQPSPEYTPTQLEQRLSAILEGIRGVGDVRVLIHAEQGQESGEIVGVLIVAQGADELTVRSELMRAARTALDLPAEAVEVFAMGYAQEGDESE